MYVQWFSLTKTKTKITLPLAAGRMTYLSRSHTHVHMCQKFCEHNVSQSTCGNFTTYYNFHTAADRGELCEF